MLFAVLRCMVGCMVPADIKNDHCWDLTGGGGDCASLLRVSSLRVYSDHIGVLGGCSTSVQIHPWPTDFGRIQYEHVDKWDEGGARHSRSGGVCQVSRHILSCTTML